MCHHPWHVDAVPVQVFQEDISIPPSQCAGLESQDTTFLLEDAQIHTQKKLNIFLTSFLYICHPLQFWKTLHVKSFYK